MADDPRRPEDQVADPFTQAPTPEQAAEQQRQLRSHQAKQRSIIREWQKRQRELSKAFGPETAAQLPELEEKPGLLNLAKNTGLGALDLITRPNYAIAAAVDEMANGSGSIISALGRAGTELGSGIGSLQGEKTSWRDVLDGLDWVDSTTLMQRYPDLKHLGFAGEAIGMMNPRGAAGLALDIVTDPLTYLSGGGAALAKIAKAKAGAQATRAATRTVQVGGSTRVMAAAGEETVALTKAGVKRRVAEQTKAFKALDVSDDMLQGEAVRLGLEEGRKRLFSSLKTQGMAPDRATDIASSLQKSLLDSDEEALKKLQAMLSGLGGRDRAYVKRSLGIDGRALTEDLVAGMAEYGREQGARIAQLGVSADAPLGALASDLALVRANEAVLEAVAAGTRGLVRKDARLRFMGLPVLPAGKSLAEAVGISGVRPRMVRALSKLPGGAPVLALAAKAGESMRGMVDALGRNLSTDFHGRKLFGFNEFRAATIDGAAGAVGKLAQQYADSNFGQWYAGVLDLKPAEQQNIFNNFARAVDNGSWKTLEPGPMRSAAEDFARFTDELLQAELERGLIHRKDVRRHYFPHFLGAPENVTRKLLTSRPGFDPQSMATVGRHAEQRGFATIDDLRRAEREAGVDAKLLVDPMQALLKRADSGVKGVLFSDFYEAVGREWGTGALPFSPAHYFSLDGPLADGASAAGRMAERLARGRRGVDLPTLDKLIEKMGSEAGGEYLRRRALKIGSRAHMNNFMNKYENYLDLLPRAATLTDEVAADGSRFVRMPPDWGGFDGALIPESAAKSMLDMRVRMGTHPDVKQLGEVYDKLQHGLKFWLTAPFPAFHFRNAYSNVLQMFLDQGLAVLNPSTHRAAAKVMSIVHHPASAKDYRKFHKALKQYGGDVAYRQADGTAVNVADLVAEIRRNKLAKQGEDLLDMDPSVFNRGPKEHVRSMTGIRKHYRRFKDKVSAVGGIIENEAKVASYIHYRKQGLSEFEAVRRVNNALFDYSDLTEVERRFFKRNFLFYTWAKKNVAFQARMLRDNPGRVATLSKLFSDVDPDVAEVKGDYEVGGRQVQIDISDGRTHARVLNGIDLPIANVDRMLPLTKLLQGNFKEAFAGVAAGLSPAARMPLELTAGKQLWNDREMDRATAQTVGKFLDPEGPTGKLIPQAMRDFVGYTKNLHKPTGRVTYKVDGYLYYMVVRNTMASRFLSSSDGWFRRRLEEGTASAWINTFTALKMDTWDLNEKKTQLMQRRLDEAYRWMRKKGLAGEHRSTFVYKPSKKWETSR